ncbi:unnamed protein product [Protopolystoma xenopodis]|uniref:Uncharacterized protein n=1 Tax=Protopolystoma xenopodis TaxID=117903 RepID=A0A448X5P0_9PLAT|nr:unnamed protein product [Protopolystoma xenopodis]
MKLAYFAQFRKSTTRTIEELTITITDMEVKYKSELSRLKKKYEATINELEINLDIANKANANLLKDNKNLAQRVKDLELLLEEERRNHEATQGNLQVRYFEAHSGRICYPAPCNVVQHDVTLHNKAASA